MHLPETIKGLDVHDEVRVIESPKVFMGKVS